MRVPSYLSPTSLDVWKKSKEDFYLQYLADNRPPRFPQTQPMSVGSAFDAYIKSHLFEAIFGKCTPAYEFTTLFESQVEVQNRDWALVNGKYCFESYVHSGAMADLLQELQKAKSEPRFESTIQGMVDGVPLLGKPDLHYVHQCNRPVILDWKVNGYCGNSMKSPEKGYIKCRDGWVGGQSNTHNQSHKACQPFNLNGFTINVAHSLDQISKTWGNQLSTYAWLLGSEVGAEFIVCIDQLACGPNPLGGMPKIRVAEFRAIVWAEFQKKLLLEYKELWEIIQSGYIFRDMTKEEALRRQTTLDNQGAAFQGEHGELMRELAGRGVKDQRPY